AAYRDVADHHHWHRQALHGNQPAAVQAAAYAGQRDEQEGERQQQRCPQAAGGPECWRGARHQLSGVWMAKVMCARPARWAACMTSMTRWCAAFASALMTTTGSLLPPVAALDKAATSAS